MRNQFPGYYKLSEEEFSNMWQECVFVFDANVLLNLYRYTPQTREELLDIFQQLIERIWIPHQAMLDYHDNREEVICQQYIIEGEIKRALEGVSDVIARYKKRGHPFADTNILEEIVAQTQAKLTIALRNEKEKHPDLLEKDYLLEKITAIFDGKIGMKYSIKRTEEIYKELEQRYRLQMPPGYKDTKDKKDGFKKFSDGLMWYQIVDNAKSQKRTIIFTTDDVKEDWWRKVKGETVGPRPELTEEILSEAGVSFHMYTASQFMKYAKVFLQLQVKQQAIDEVRGIEQQDKEDYQLRSTPIDSHMIKHVIDAQTSLASLGVDVSTYTAGTKVATELMEMGLGKQLSSSMEMLNSFSELGIMEQAARSHELLNSTKEISAFMESVREQIKMIEDFAQSTRIVKDAVRAMNMFNTIHPFQWSIATSSTYNASEDPDTKNTSNMGEDSDDDFEF